MYQVTIRLAIDGYEEAVSKQPLEWQKAWILNAIRANSLQGDENCLDFEILISETESSFPKRNSSYVISAVFKKEDEEYGILSSLLSSPKFTPRPAVSSVLCQNSFFEIEPCQSHQVQENSLTKNLKAFFDFILFTLSMVFDALIALMTKISNYFVEKNNTSVCANSAYA